MEHTGAEIFDLGTGQGTSVLELLETFSRVDCTEVPYAIPSRHEGDIPVCYANADKAFLVLGRQAKRNLEDMCRGAWRWGKTRRSFRKKRCRHDALQKISKRK